MAITGYCLKDKKKVEMDAKEVEFEKEKEKFNVLSVERGD